MMNSPNCLGVRQRRGRSTTVSAILTVLAGFVGLFIFGSLSPWFRDAGYAGRVREYDRLRARFKDKLPSSLMVMGSSKTQCSIAAGVLAKEIQDACGSSVLTFNFSIPGAPPTSHLLNLHRLIRDGKAPDFLILEASPVFLTNYHPEIEYWNLEPDERSLMQEAGVKLAGDQLKDRFRMSWFEKRHILVAMARRRWNLRELGFNTSPALDRWGDLIRPEMETSPADRARLFDLTLHEYGDRCKNLEIGGLQLEALKRTLALADRAGIPCALMMNPEGERFHKLYSPTARQSIAELVGEIHATWNVPLFDARHWMLDESNYADSHHVTPRSSIAFTERLARDKIIPWLKRIESTGTRDNPFRTTSR